MTKNIFPRPEFEIKYKITGVPEELSIDKFKNILNRND